LLPEPRCLPPSQDPPCDAGDTIAPIGSDGLAEAEPDIVVLQELEALQVRFPEGAIRDLGYDAIWHGQKRWNGVAILSRVGTIHETPRGLLGNSDPSQSRYIEAAVNGILIGGLYLPNGNPRPGPKFDYKLAWFEKLIEHAGELMASGLPVILLGDFIVMRLISTSTNQSAGLMMHFFRQRSKLPMHTCRNRAGPMPCDICMPVRPFTPSGIICARLTGAMPASESTTTSQSIAGRKTRGRAGRCPCAWLGQDQRSCAGLGRTLRPSQMEKESHLRT
jgi:hypothetical protein